MTEHWLEVLEWIQLAITLAFLVALVGVLVAVLRYHRLEFNVLWKTRVFIVAVAIMWVLSLLLGRQQLWRPDGGLLSSSTSRYEELCRAYVFLTFGIWQPLFFLAILMTLRSKERSKMDLYLGEQNKFIIYQSLLWCIPIFIVHTVILGLSGVREGHGNNALVWGTYSRRHQHCVVPVLSTTAFAAFYACFILFYIMSSRKLFARLLNHSLRNRIRLTQLFFVFVFPFEIIVRFILIFISKFEKPYEALYHTYFFMDLIVCAVAVSELVLLPVLDAASYPLMKGGTAQACKDYEKAAQDGARRNRKSTRNIPPLVRVMSAEGVDVDAAKDKQARARGGDPRQVELHETTRSGDSSDITSEDWDSPPSLKHVPSVKLIPSVKHTAAPPSAFKHTPSMKGGDPSDSKPILMQTSAEDFDKDDDDPMGRGSLHVKLPPSSSYPANIEDIFANIDDLADDDALENSSLKLKVSDLSFDE